MKVVEIAHLKIREHELGIGDAMSAFLAHAVLDAERVIKSAHELLSDRMENHYLWDCEDTHKLNDWISKYSETTEKK